MAAIQPVTLDEVRAHLRLAEDDYEVDSLLARMIAAARRSAERMTGISLAGAPYPIPSDDDLAVIGQAMLLTIAAWYANPEAVTADARTMPMELPRSAGWLLGSIKKRVL